MSDKEARARAVEALMNLGIVRTTALAAGGNASQVLAALEAAGLVVVDRSEWERTRKVLDRLLEVAAETNPVAALSACVELAGLVVRFEPGPACAGEGE